MNHVCHTFTSLLLATSVLLPLVGCGQSTSSGSTDAAVADDAAPTLLETSASTDATASLDGAPTEVPAIVLDASPTEVPTSTPPPAAGLVVVHSTAKYDAVLVSLVDPATRTVTHDNCLSTSSSVLSDKLSGDVVLPSQRLLGGAILLIDRGNRTLVWLDPATCKVESQVTVSPGFKGDPHDVAYAPSVGRYYVTRYNTNPAPSADPAALDQGGDVLVLDAQNHTLLGRIDLLPFAAPTAAGAKTTPNPDRAVVVGDTLYVSLNNFAADYTAGPATIAMIDLVTSRVRDTIVLPTLQNCGTLALATNQSNVLVTACNGSFMDTNQVDASGFAWIDLSTTPPTATIVSAAGLGAPVSNSDLVALDAKHAFGIVAGDFGSRNDALFAFDFGGGVPQKILEGGASYVLGGLVYDPTSKNLFLGDAEAKAPTLRVFDVSTPATPVELPAFSSDPGQGLYPHSLALF